jgi:hypothetical protein
LRGQNSDGSDGTVLPVVDALDDLLERVQAHALPVGLCATQRGAGEGGATHAFDRHLVVVVVPDHDEVVARWIVFADFAGIVERLGRYAAGVEHPLIVVHVQLDATGLVWRDSAVDEVVAEVDGGQGEAGGDVGRVVLRVVLVWALRELGEAVWRRAMNLITRRRGSSSQKYETLITQDSR